jgi:hypothetical protein
MRVTEIGHEKVERVKIANAVFVTSEKCDELRRVNGDLWFAVFGSLKTGEDTPLFILFVLKPRILLCSMNQVSSKADYNRQKNYYRKPRKRSLLRISVTICCLNGHRHPNTPVYKINLLKSSSFETSSSRCFT